MPKHPLKIERIAYSEARSRIRVGDGIGCRGNGLVSRAIRLCRGGCYDLSHWATVIRDLEIGAAKRIQVFEFTGDGAGMKYLSQAYTEQHGKVFWMPMHCTAEQQDKMIDKAADLEWDDVGYDFQTTWGAIFNEVLPLDVAKFNCSEGGYHLLVDAGRVAQRYNKKGKKIAPVPGDMPVWCEAKEIYELVF